MKYLLLLSFSICSCLLWAQPVISNAYFVEAGDILKTRTDNHPDASILPQGTGAQTWDYTALSYTNNLTIDSFYAASDGPNSEDFPNAQVVKISNGTAMYFEETSTEQKIIGLSGVDPTGLGLFSSVFYEIPAIFRIAPLEAFGDYNYNSAVSFIAATSELPEALQNQLVLLNPDSLKIQMFNTVQAFGDAYGQMEIPEGIYEVLRLKTTEYQSTKVLLLAKNSTDWNDITSLVEFAFPDLPGLGTIDTIKHFVFYADSITEPIADMYVDNTGEVTKVTYKSSLLSPVFGVDDKRPSLTAYPNPVEEEVMFQINDVTPGQYQIRIFNILGSAIWNKDYTITSGQNLFWENLSTLTKGTYLMSLVDKNNHTLSTQRLVVIRP